MPSHPYSAWPAETPEPPIRLDGAHRVRLYGDYGPLLDVLEHGDTLLVDSTREPHLSPHGVKKQVGHLARALGKPVKWSEDPHRPWLFHATYFDPTRPTVRRPVERRPTLLRAVERRPTLLRPRRPHSTWRRWNLFADTWEVGGVYEVTRADAPHSLRSIRWRLYEVADARGLRIVIADFARRDAVVFRVESAH